MPERTVLSVIPGPTFGGAANQLVRLHGPLRERGFRLVGVLPDDPGNAVARVRDAGVEVVVVPMRRLRATANPALHAQLARALRRQVADLRALVRERDAALVQNHGDLNPYGALAGHREGAAVAWQLLDTRTPPALRRATMPLVTRVADVVLTVGDALAEVHPGAQDLGERCVCTPPPVDTAQFRPDLRARARAREELGVRRGTVVLGAIGNRNPQKGHEWLLRAAAAVREHHPRVAVRILGAASPGHERHEASLRALAQGDVAFVDPGDRVAELVHALDVLVVSSVPRSEGMPTVILEAMAAGLPVVATDVGAVREMVADGVTGLVVAPCDHAALTEALCAMAADPARRAAMGAAGRLAVLDRFGLEACADRYAGAYDLALRHRAGRRRAGALRAAA